MILLLYMDDLFLTGKEKLINECKKKLAKKIEMKYLGTMHYFLGLEVWKFLDDIFLHQGKYTVDPKQIWDVGLQGNEHSDGDKPKSPE